MSTVSNLNIVRRFKLFSSANGIGASLTAADMLILLALFYGATDSQMVWVYAAFHLSGFAVIFSPYFLQGKNTSTVFAAAWWTRALVTIGFLLLPLLASNQLRVICLIILLYAFCIVRSVGLLGYGPAFKNLIRKRDIPSVNAMLLQSYFVTSLGCYILSSFVFKWQIFGGDERAFMVLIGIGVVFNFVSSMAITNLPPTEIIQAVSPVRMLGSIGEVIRSAASREVVLITVMHVFILVLSKYTLNHMKNNLHWQSGRLFMVVVIGLIGSILVSWGLKIIGNRIGIRALLLGIHGPLALCGLAWSFVGMIPQWMEYFGVLGLHFVTTFFLMGSLALVSRISTERLPDGNGVTYYGIYSLAGVVGSLAGVGLTPVLLSLDFGFPSSPSMSSYSNLFLVWTVICLIICLRSMFIKVVQGPSVWKELVILAPNNLWTMIRARQTGVEEVKRPKIAEVSQLLTGANTVAKKYRMEYLQSSDYLKRYLAMRQLMNIVPSEEEMRLIREEAADRESPLLLDAITALGLIGSKKDCLLLHSYLQDQYQEAAAIKSLLRLGEDLSDETIWQAYLRQIDNQNRMEIIFGCAATARKKCLEEIMTLEFERSQSRSWLSAILHGVAVAWDQRRAMEEILLRNRMQFDEVCAAINNELSGKLSKAWLESLQNLIRANHYQELQDLLYNKMPVPWLKGLHSPVMPGVLYIWHVIAEENKQEL